MAMTVEYLALWVQRLVGMEVGGLWYDLTRASGLLCILFVLLRWMTHLLYASLISYFCGLLTMISNIYMFTYTCTYTHTYKYIDVKLREACHDGGMLRLSQLSLAMLVIL